MTVLEQYDDGSQIEFWGYAGGGSTYGAWSEVTLARRSADGSTEVMRYIIVDRQPGPHSAAENQVKEKL